MDYKLYRLDPFWGLDFDLARIGILGRRPLIMSTIYRQLYTLPCQQLSNF